MKNLLDLTPPRLVRVTRWCVAPVAMAVFLMVSATASATLINDFDAGLESWRYDFGGPGSISYDAAEGSPGNPLGAAKLTFSFPYAGSIAFTGDVFGSPTDLTGLPLLKFDIKIDTANSSQDAFGNYGYMEMVSRETGGYSWGGQPGQNLTAASGWQTFSVSTTSGLTMAQTRALTLQLYGGAPQNIPGPVTVWLDNIRTVPEPGTISLLGLATIFNLMQRRRKVNC